MKTINQIKKFAFRIVLPIFGILHLVACEVNPYDGESHTLSNKQTNALESKKTAESCKPSVFRRYKKSLEIYYNHLDDQGAFDEGSDFKVDDDTIMFGIERALGNSKKFGAIWEACTRSSEKMKVIYACLGKETTDAKKVLEEVGIIYYEGKSHKSSSMVLSGNSDIRKNGLKTLECVANDLSHYVMNDDIGADSDNRNYSVELNIIDTANNKASKPL